MVIAKPKKLKRKSQDKITTNTAQKIKAKPWKKVKIRGKVISDDGLTEGFEGLIGLEVLKDYDEGLVETSKTKLSRKEQREAKKKQKSQSKAGKLPEEKLIKATTVEDLDRDEFIYDDSSADEQEQAETITELKPITKKQKKKEAFAERIAEKLKKRKEKREERKLKRKEKQQMKVAGVPEQAVVKHKTGKKTKQEATSKKKIGNKKQQKNASEDDEEDEELVPELVPLPTATDDQSLLNVDELEHWNGLGVPQPILRALATQGFKSPTEIQTMTLPAAILGKKDILGAAETGSGKTLAFGIPILAGIMELKAKNSQSGIRKAVKRKTQENDSKATPTVEESDVEDEPLTEEDIMKHFNSSISESEDSSGSDDEATAKEAAANQQNPLYAVVLTPTRELAVQVKNHLVAAAKYTGIKIAAIFGGLAIAKQERILKQCPEIVVATPGRFWELYQQENPHISKIDNISFLVIDETDRMVEKGHFEELRSLLKVLNADETKKQARQNFVFSATLTLVHDLPDHMQKRNAGKRPKFVKQTSEMKIQALIEELGISQPKIVDITRSQQTAQSLTECRLICSIDQKDYYLYYFIQRHPGRSIVFCNSIDCVKRLATLFGLLNCNPLPLHANMIQKQRLKNLERFRDNPNGLLIATDVAARGLDIPNVDHVIHYQVPRTSENYVHRSGRTARASKDGITVMFMEPGEVRNYVKLYKTLGRTEDLPLFPVSERYLAAVKERVNLAREVDKLELKVRRKQSEIGWMKKHAEEMEMIIDGYNDESGSDQDEDPYILERRKERVHLTSVRAQLKNLLGKEIFPRGFSFKYPTSTGQLQTPTSAGNASVSAVKVMQNAIEDMKVAKKQRNKKKKSK